MTVLSSLRGAWTPGTFARAGLWLWLSVHLAAQPPATPRGFAARSFHHEPSSPFAISATTAGLGGHVIAAMRNEVRDLDGAGSATPLYRLPAGDSIGFLTRVGQTTKVLFSSFLANRLHVLDLATLALTTTTLPKNAFDAEMLPNGVVLASASPLFPLPNAATGIWRIDPVAGQHREVIHLSGPSGPLCRAANGDLFVAILPSTVPPPAGSVRIACFSAAQVLSALGSGPVLVEADAKSVLTGLDGAYDLALDDRGRLLWSDPNQGGVRRASPGSTIASAELLLAAPVPTLSLAFVEGTNATFDAFQPEHGGELVVLTSDWLYSCTALRITTARAWIVTSPGGSAAPGPVSVHAFEALPLATLGTLVSFAAPGPEQILATIAGTPGWWGFPSSTPVAWFVTNLDAAGHGHVDLIHPGGFTATVWFQAAFLGGPNMQTFGTTKPQSLLLQR